MKALGLRRRAVFYLLALFLLGSLGWSGCSRTEDATEPATPTEQPKQADGAAAVPDTIQRHWTFLNRLRQNDPFDVIDRTMVDDQNQLGVELDSSVTADKVPDLMKKVMARMAEEFPREDVTLSAYGPGHPLHKFGTVHLDGKTGQAIYTPSP
jgi:hypothetical protein